MDKALKQKFKSCASFQELQALLQDLPETPDARTVEFCSRILQRFQDQAGLRIAYLGNHTLEPLPRYTALACARQGLLLRHYLGQYNQYFQEVLDPGSGLHAFAPQLVFLSLSLRVLAPDIYGRFLELSPARRREEMDRILDHVEQWLAAARERTEAALLIANFPRPPHPQAGIADARLEWGEMEFYAELNLELQRRLRRDPRAFVYDLDQVLARCGRLAAHDAKMYFLAKMEWAEPCLPHLAAELRRLIRGIRGDTRKCLVLDLDNTLWGGVVGEDGVDGIRIGPGDPVGEAFQAFQQGLRALKERGVVLALCSKNNPEDAREAFEKREMPLRLEDFAALRINWEPKHKNVQEIADLLNIGTDSLVFMDDNPAECELVRQTLPEVRVICLPPDPAEYAGLLARLDDFEKPELTEEDRKKSEQYRQNARREVCRREAGDLTAYLESLGTRLALFPAASRHLARIHQLFNKTNQFNVTTKRYQQSEIERFLADTQWELRLAAVRDNFGDLGIVGLYLVRDQGDEAEIDSFVLSCRALGRGIETAMMNQIKQDCLLSGRYTALRAEFRPTAKNAPAARFYSQQGFERLDTDEQGTQYYRLRAGDAQILPCPGIRLTDEED